MKKPENWALTKAKLIPNGGIQVYFTGIKKDKTITHTEEWEHTNTANPHDDLTDKFEQLKPFIAECFGMDKIVVLSNSKGIGADSEDAFNKVKPLINDTYQQVIDKIDVFQIKITGSIDDDKDNRSVVISSKMEMENGSKCALNSPAIKLNLLKFGFEEDLQEIINGISEEVQRYLYDGKRAEPSLFDQQEEKKENQLEVA